MWNRFPWTMISWGKGPDFPDLNEMGVVRHYTRLSQWNFGVDTGMYPLGSCTMKYNPKINEKVSQLKGFADCTPCCRRP
jgi:glycine dehydrogenase subunit 2